MTAEVRRRQRAAIRSELIGPPTVPQPIGGTKSRAPRLALVAATLLIGPLGAVLASAGAVPGDTLYPTKLALERVISVVDNDVTAGNRLDELEALIHRRASASVIRTAQDEAYAAVADFEDLHPFRHHYRDLVVGARQGAGGLEPGYRYEGTVDWDAGQAHRASMPDGGLLTVRRVDSDFEVEVGDGWQIDALTGDRWYLSSGGIDAASVGADVFGVRVEGDTVEISLLDEPPVVPGPERLTVEVKDATDERSSNEDEVEEADEVEPDSVETEPGEIARETQPVTTAPAASPSTTTASTVPSTKPSTTAKPSTTRPSTTRPPTTRPSTTRPPTTPPTTVPTTTTTICDDDDDFEEADDDECDD